MHTKKLLIITCALLSITTSALVAKLSVGITPADTGTSQLTSYQFQFTVGEVTSGEITAGSYFAVTFPLDY